MRATTPRELVRQLQQIVDQGLGDIPIYHDTEHGEAPVLGVVEVVIESTPGRENHVHLT